jgi:1,4-dihydroxy-2-naphthoyl-CoA synthase
MAQRFGVAFEALQRLVPWSSRPSTATPWAAAWSARCPATCGLRGTRANGAARTSVGLLPAGCGTQTLPWLVGEGWAKRMILTNERVNAETALRIGLVEQVVPRGQSRQRHLQLAQRVSTLSPQRREFQQATHPSGSYGHPAHAALALERERFIDLFEGVDQAEGVNAFLEKRKPRVEKRLSERVQTPRKSFASSATTSLSSR